MTPLEIVLLIAMALCAITLTMTVINLGVYQRPMSDVGFRMSDGLRPSVPLCLCAFAPPDFSFNPLFRRSQRL